MISLTGIHKTVVDGRRKVRVLDAINFTIDKGEFVSVIGPSGSGKSTLLNVLGLLDKPSGGEYSFAGESVLRLSAGRLATFRNRRIGFVFQSFMLLPRMSALENVELPLLYSSLSHRERRKQCEAALAGVGMLDKARQRAINLSGGEKQRIAIARALVNNPDLILADEPTGNLDDAAKNGILQIFANLKSQGRTIVMVTHDIQAALIADRCLRIQGGNISPANLGSDS
jgi:putative ABC transport system ATP-binding protein